MKEMLLFIAIIFASCTKQSNLLESSVINSRTTYTLSGKIVWSGDTSVGVGLVTINLTGPETNSFVTTSNGLYSFTVSTPGIYTITPVKTVNLLNGVTGVGGDATAIQQYLTGMLTLNAFQKISADVNKNNMITSGDATIINQASLGNLVAQTILSPSWTFVDRSYSFGSVPPIPAYPKTITINVSSNSTQLDFVGIKRGDVNNSANPSL